MTIAIVLSFCALRVALLRHPIAYSRADETSIRLAAISILHAPRGYLARARAYARDPAQWSAPGPLRLLSLWTCALSMRILRRTDYLPLAVVSTLGSCACVACAGALGGPAAAALVGSSALVLGLGRRALQDIPMLALQMLVLLAVDRGHWVAVGMLLVALALWKEAGVLSFPVLWAWALHRTGLYVLPTALFAGAGVLWLGVTSYLLGTPTWRFWRAVSRAPKPKDIYTQTMVGGGSHRLIVDLALCSPAVLVLAPWSLAFAVGLACYGLFAIQEIRIAVILDVLLRLALAVVAPWYVLIAVMATDLWIWYRAWYRADIYCPVTAWLVWVLGMGPNPWR